MKSTSLDEDIIEFDYAYSYDEGFVLSEEEQEDKEIRALRSMLFGHAFYFNRIRKG